MRSAFRHIEIDVDALRSDSVHKSFGAKILFGAAAEEECMHLLVELLAIGKDAIVARRYVEAEDCTTECAYV